MGAYDEYLDRSLWGPSEPLHRKVAARLLEVMATTGNLDISSTDLLEIGAGTGRVGVQARAMGFRSYIGVEPTSALADHCETTHGLNICRESLPELVSFEPETFDAVFSMHVLEHAPNYLAAREWCEEMKRVVKVGGIICVAAPDILDYREFFWNGDWSHGFPTTADRVAQLFRDVGLNVEFAGSLHFGRRGVAAAAVAHLLSFLIPTRLVDAMTRRLVGRPLASGIKIAALWGTVFVVGRR